MKHAGQAVALVVADSNLTARRSASTVRVTYTDIQKPVVDLRFVNYQTTTDPTCVLNDKLKGKLLCLRVYLSIGGLQGTPSELGA